MLKITTDTIDIINKENFVATLYVYVTLIETIVLLSPVFTVIISLLYPAPKVIVVIGEPPVD